MVLTGREKATIFLSILGAETSARVLRYLPDELADLIAAGINHLPTPSPDVLSEVLSEYQSFLALPERTTEYIPPRPSAPKRAIAGIMYERPQTIAFLLSLMTDDERADVLSSMPRERAVIEELLNTLKPNLLQPKLAEKMKEIYKGRIF